VNQEAVPLSVISISKACRSLGISTQSGYQLVITAMTKSKDWLILLSDLNPPEEFKSNNYPGLDFTN